MRENLNSEKVIPVGNPHDGVVHSDCVTFTTTNGHLMLFDSGKDGVPKDLDLNFIDSGHKESSADALGWCRGVCFETDLVAWVGFSRIRPTWLRKNLSWLKQGFRNLGEYGTQPTRIGKYDLESQALVQEINLESAGINAIFGIYLMR